MKFNRLEAVRGFAAFYVCLGHLILADANTNTLLKVAFKFGQEAVMVFFVLSGFVVSWATIKPDARKESFRTYFLKRFTRIYSVWFLAILALFLMASISAGTFVLESPLRLLGNLFMLQDFAAAKPAVICDAAYGDTPLWSLHYEWWFYMIFPGVMLISNLKSRSHTVGVMAIIGSVSYVLIPNPLSRLFMYFGIWWIGGHAAAVNRKNGEIRLADLHLPIMYVAIAAIPLLFLCVQWVRSGNEWSIGIHPILETRHMLSAILLVCFAFAWRKANWFGFRQTIGLFSWVAPISFSLYVLHYNSIVHASYLSGLENPILETIFYILLTVLFCIFAELVAYPWIRRVVLPPKQSKNPATLN